VQEQEDGSRKKKRTYAALHDNSSSSDNPLLTMNNLLNPIYKELMQTTINSNVIELVETTSNYL
jgi:hypothetical protein